MEVEDIVNQGSFEGKREMVPWLEQMMDLVEILDERKSIHSEALDFLKERIGAFFKLRKSENKDLNLNQLVERVIASAKDLCSHRNVKFTTELEDDIHIWIDSQIIDKAAMGIIKNAIENTPDGGDLSVSLRQRTERIELEIKDTGVGITDESQKHIFGGFYHSLETDLYSTKKPFEFGAGGKGLDLLRIKIFSETYNFQVNCSSTRCRYIPLEKDICPGDIAKCPHIQSAEECAQSGGTSFKIVFERETKNEA
jgi:signal transduction histidine kinase